MTLPSVRKTLGAHTYELTKFGARRGLAFTARLSHVLGPGLGKMAASGAGEQLLVAISEVLRTINPEETVSMAEEVMGQTKLVIVGQFGKAMEMAMPFDWDEHFAGKYADLVDLMLFAIEYNDFLEPAVRAFMARTNGTSKSSDSDRVSSGGSTVPASMRGTA